ncbi:hypothetical protein [Spirosoma pomorum]
MPNSKKPTIKKVDINFPAAIISPEDKDASKPRKRKVTKQIDNLLTSPRSAISNPIIYQPTPEDQDFVEVPVLYKRHSFSATAKEVMRAVANGEQIDGVNIGERLLDPSFRFELPNDPDYATDLSDAFTALLARQRTKTVSKMSEGRIKQADEYATKMFSVIKEMQDNAGVTTLRGTVDLLNENSVKTFKPGGKWHMGTVQGLQRRWKELGLSSDEPKTK